MSEVVKFKSQPSIGDIDRENGIIFGVSIITGGREALGHGSFVDDTMVDQVVALGKETDKGPGLKARFDHPNSCFKSIGTAVGRFKNFRKDGDKARADLHLLDSAASSPEGDLRKHLLDLASEDPDIFATSIVFRPGESVEFSTEDFPDKNENDPFFMPHSRVDSLLACDVVDEGAANDSLFGNPNYMANQVESWTKENPEIIKGFLDTYFNNQKQSMEDNNKELTGAEKLSEKISNVVNKFFPSKETKEAETTETVEVELNDLEEENKQLSSDIKVKDASIEALTTKNDELKSTIDTLREDFGNLNAEVEKLKSVELGTVITSIENEQPLETVATPAEKMAQSKEDRAQYKAEELAKAKADLYPELKAQKLI